jgi:hypothetical protein
MKTLCSDEKGVSEVIGAILIFTILVAFLGMLQVYGVPAWNKETEFGHFNRLYDDFLDMKRIIQDTAVYDLPRTAVLHTSLDYQVRMFLVNPPKPSAVLTTSYDKYIAITYNGNITERVNSCTLRVEEKYNYFTAPAFVLEHGMIIGDANTGSYKIDDPPITKNNMDLLIMGCDNSSSGTTGSLNLHVYPVLLNTLSVSNATLSFNTDYPLLWGSYLSSMGADYSVAGDIITVNYKYPTKIKVMHISLGAPSNLSLLPASITPAPVPSSLVLESFETVGDGAYSGSGAGSYNQNTDPSYVSHLNGSLQMNYDFSLMLADKNLTVDIDYQRYTPAQSFDITGYSLLRIDVFGDSSGYDTSLSISSGAAKYEWAPVGIDWSGWRTLNFALSEASASGVDLGAVDAVQVKIQEPEMVGNMSVNKTGTVYYDYLRASD